MQTKWPPKWQFNTKIKENFPETGKLQGFACKMLILLFLEVQTSLLYHPSDASAQNLIYSRWRPGR